MGVTMRLQCGPAFADRNTSGFPNRHSFADSKSQAMWHQGITQPNTATQAKCSKIAKKVVLEHNLQSWFPNQNVDTGLAPTPCMSRHELSSEEKCFHGSGV